MKKFIQIVVLAISFTGLVACGGGSSDSMLEPIEAETPAPDPDQPDPVQPDPEPTSAIELPDVPYDY